eukprot:14729937-Alexandrium_andersonii.AAC.1
MTASPPSLQGRTGPRPRRTGRRRGVDASWRPSTLSASTGSWLPRRTRAMASGRALEPGLCPPKEQCAPGWQLHALCAA